MIFLRLVDQKFMKFCLLDGETLPKEGAIAFLALLDFLQLLDDFLGSAGTQLAAHANITYLQPFNTYTKKNKPAKEVFSKTFF